VDPEKTFMRHKSEKDITFHLSMIVSEMRMRPGLVSINLRILNRVLALEAYKGSLSEEALVLFH